MHIGVYAMNYTPNVGGAFTLEQDVLAALRRTAPSRSHQWTLFSRHPMTDLPANVAGVVLSRPWTAGTIRWLMKITGVQRHTAGAIGMIESGHESAVRAVRPDVLWNMGPYTLSADVPYWTTIFDLQHRLSPHFPEVSVAGEWERREFHYRWLLGRATGAFVGTPEGAAQINRFYPNAGRISVLPFPTPSDALDLDVSAVPSTPGGSAPLLLYPAQFWPHKNHITVLKMLAQLQQRHGVAAQLVFVGADKGNRTHVMDTARALGVERLVSVRGFVSRAELLDLYRRAFALVYASTFGPDNLPPLEAGALGCPVIMADVPGCREQLGEAACIVGAHDVDQWTSAVLQLLTDPVARERLVSAGQQRARAWTADQYVARAIEAFEAFEPVRSLWHTA